MATQLKRSKFQSFTKPQKEEEHEETLEVDDDFTFYFTEYVDDNFIQFKDENEKNNNNNTTKRVNVISPKAIKACDIFDFED